MIHGLISPTTAVNLLVAGDSVVWVFFDLDHLPEDGWAVSLALSRSGVNLLSKAGVAVGDNWSFGLLTTDTTGLAPGYAQAYLLYTKDADRVSVYEGDLTIQPNPSATITPTPAMAALTAVKNTITLILSQPESTASFNGQTYTLQNITALLDARNQLQAQVNSELAALGLDVRKNFRTILTRFR